MGYHKRRKSARKLVDIERYVSKCMYCNKDIYSTDSFVALVKTLEPATYNYAHYQCMKEEDNKQQQDPRHNQN